MINRITRTVDRFKVWLEVKSRREVLSTIGAVIIGLASITVFICKTFVCFTTKQAEPMTQQVSKPNIKETTGDDDDDEQSIITGNINNSTVTIDQKNN
jgi:apolipoprotein N-acyltransferase